MVCTRGSLHMHTMVTGRAQALGTKNEANAYNQNGRALCRHLSLLVPASGKQTTQKETGERVWLSLGYG